MGSKILKFRQTLRGREFSYLCLRIVQVKFWDCFRTIRDKFLVLFTDSPERIFGTIFGQFWPVLRFGFDLGIDVFGFYGVFWYPNNSVTNRERTRGALFYVGPTFRPFCVLLS